MSVNYSKQFNRRQTPQNQPIPGSGQVANNAGGYGWQVDPWTQLDRFLILGAEGGTYYVGQRDLINQNHDNILRCLREDGLRVVDRIVEISGEGRAPKNDPAIFALALAACEPDLITRKAAFKALPKVCRIGTHLFHFAEYINAMRGWGRGLRKAVADWYLLDRDIENLALQVIKYQQRDGWSHRDLLRLAHPQVYNPEQNAVLSWAVGKAGSLEALERCPDLIRAFEVAKVTDSKRQLLDLITTYKLPRECIPTHWLDCSEVWDALLQNMPMTAMLRNLAKMTAVGLIKPLSASLRMVRSRLETPEAIRSARVHPLAILNALKIYGQGHGDKGKLTWTPVQGILDSLDEAFYLSFKNVVPSNQPVVLALDVSGSMDQPMAGTSLTCREATGALAMITAAVEPEHHILAFSHELVPLGISRKTRLDDVLKKIDDLSFGATDCSLPMTWALENRITVGGFSVYTDSETWYGRIHPTQALRKYRGQINEGARSAVVAMVSNRISIADPNDKGMLDVVGFDTATPGVISDFFRADAVQGYSRRPDTCVPGRV